MSLEYWQNGTDRGKPKYWVGVGETNWHVVGHKSHIYGLGMERN